MRSEMEYASTIVMHTFAQEHVTELADGRIRQYPLDVQLEQGHGLGEESGYASYDSNDLQCGGRDLEQWVGTSNEIHPGGYHGCGMDQRADRRGTLHSVRKPHI